eukprot:XP_011661742.1 PREDICTED: multiple epidermal growth factor-like domains protein 8 [Strongylocentrotus purpuratus]
MAKAKPKLNPCSDSEHLQSGCYSKKSEENLDLIFTLAENVRCMQQRSREDSSLSRSRNGESRATEMWKSGRLREGSTSRRRESERNMKLKGHHLSGNTKRNTLQTVHGIFPSIPYWKTFLITVLLCVFLKSQACSAKCYGLGSTGRAILTDLQGFISDHPNKSYPISTECEWLIQAPSSDMRIMLTFTKFATECGYDFVSVYDGNSHQSPMIAALSGDSIPSTLLAESGQMLIYMYSDRNYNLLGFDATYTIEDCPYGCSGHGTCVDHSCVCNSGYHGDGCERLSCPYECGSEWNQGVCQQSGVQQCSCSAGFVGEGCSLSTNSNLGWGQTFLVSSGASEGLSKRAGHASVYHEETDSLWTYGGFDLNRPSDDLVQYSFETDEWTQITPNGSVKPSGRYRHTMELYENHLLVFGGVLVNGSWSNELWSFDLATLSWELLPSGTESVPPGLAHHSSCIVEYSYLVIIGGASQEQTFLGSIYKYDLQLLQGWEEITPRGGLEREVRLRDHTSVYHYDTKSILVFGGLKSPQTHNTLVSSRVSTVYAFQFEDRYWTKLSSSGSVRARSYHTANIIGNYMVVYGGNVHQHLSNNGGYVDVQDGNYGEHEKCFEDGIELYHLGCHKWVSLNEIAGDFQDPRQYNPYTVTKGRFAHTAVVRDGTTLVVIGGFNGVTQSDIFAVKMPGSVAINPATVNESLNPCGSHISVSNCTLDPACAWCPQSSTCFGFSDSQSCSGALLQADCPGICSALTACEACMLWGQGAQTATFDPEVTHVNEQCGWCVQDRACYPLSAPAGKCDPSASDSGAWWGPSGTFIATFDQCKTGDFPPGMMMMRYTHPQNLSHPDQISIVSDTLERITYYPVLQSSEVAAAGFYTVVMKGFIHPQGATSPSVWIRITKAEGTLEISSDDNPANAVKLAERASSSTIESPIQAKRSPASAPIFPDTSPGTRYYATLEERKPITASMQYSSSAMELLWDGYVESGLIYHSFTSDYLQPYKSDSCTNYSTCRGCLTDAACGWCPLSDTCELRDGPTLSMDRCGTSNRPIEHYLVLDEGNCGNCSQHWNCDLCTTDPLCEWMNADVSCTRRGRFETALKDPAQCLPKCQEITDCTGCIGIKNCAWCADTMTCLHFPTYISSFIHGECSHWYDQEDTVCPTCSAHQTCDDCLDTFQCGWCGNTNDPDIGICQSGDFNGPYSNMNCSAVVAEANETSVLSPADWSYEQCPDVDECRLGRHDCHGNATCLNTYEGFDCRCNYGFKGDGKIFCNSTCFHTCELGYCSGMPDFECVCDLGWTGVSCNISCGCNNHSTCVNGVGLCDECQEWSTGSHCQYCLPGSYGDATTPTGCVECDCHGHGNASMGNCDGTTGLCYCTGNTLGDNCETCEEGFFGEPQNEGKCYQKCNGRSILTNVHSSRLGSYEGLGVQDPNHGYCLWVLTTFGSLVQASGALSSPGAITLTVDTLDVECGRDYVHVYDGIPEHLWENFGVSVASQEIGAFCGHSSSAAIRTTAYSGVMTIAFQANVSATSPTQGFTAVYDVRTCQEDCDGNWHCANEDEDELEDDQVCECRAGYTGDDCEEEICPDDCGVLEGRGACNDHLLLCICNEGYSGAACDIITAPSKSQSKAVWSLLYDADRLSSNANIGPTSRMGHTMVADGGGKFWLFGGYSQDNQRLNDVWSYDASASQWTHHPSGNSPSARNYHAASFVAPDRMIISGGLSDSEVLSDWWIYSLTQRTWLEISAPIDDLQIAGHTMNMVDDTTLIVIGGYSPTMDLLEKIINFDISTLTGHFKSSQGTTPTGHLNINVFLILLGWSTGAQPRPLHSHVATTKDDMVYLFGGYDGSTYGSMSTADMPSDLCTLQTTSDGCKATPGCSACVRSNSTLVACFSIEEDSSVSCESPNQLSNGTMCDNAFIEGRNCSKLSICSECVTVYPSHPSAQQTCKWCYNCPEGACIPTAANCMEEHNCQVETQKEYHDRSVCSETICEASDCTKCTSGSSPCVWTRQFKRSSETRRLLNYRPIYDWNCFSNHLLTVAPSHYNISSVPPLSCPTPCHQHTTCGDCLTSQGSDGGWQECMWSPWLNQCMSPTFLHLRCAVGECGPVAQGASDNCPTQCFANTQCSHCLHQAWCGWCPVPGVNGSGICLSGGLLGPIDGVCSSQEISSIHGPLPPAVANATMGGISGTPQWKYLTCPPEDECVNGNHDCGENEDCTDTYTSFECNCKAGYERESGDGPCKGQFAPRCVGEHGVCVALNIYVGHNCSTECLCNGHSNCLSESAKAVCLECRNNTMGEHCEHCLPLFVGNPEDGGSCTPCIEHCNGNTNQCLSVQQYQEYRSEYPTRPIHNISQLFNSGPLTDDVFCIGCSNFSEGERCESCIDSYFKLEEHCQKCDCNGHGDMCEKTSGGCKECLNNTMSPQCPSDKYPEPCWEHQCSQCLNDLFKGTPTDSHQCYRQMHVDNDICFNPESQDDCPINPVPLPDGASSFFVIMPKYSDLDIRLTVDITYGSLNVYVTYDSDVFIVEYDEETQQQIIRIDENYVSASMQRKRRSIREFYAPSRGRRSSNSSISTTIDPDQSELTEIESHGLNTFISIDEEHFITLVQDLQNRLVITFPRRYHTLTSRRFYIALMGRGVEDQNATQGIMYFRQDQPHIDLFIFFSVFLSCFFLFLAFLIGIWKVKVGVEARQHRRMHLLEMEHRASRPFGQVLLYYESPSIQTHPAPTGTTKSYSLPKKHHRLGRMRAKAETMGGGGAANRDTEETALNSAEIINERFTPGLIASEPTDDGMATVGTVVFALPGQMRAPVRACLGSALVTLKTVAKQTQDTQNTTRQQRQGKNLKSSILCNTNNRR